MGFFLAIVAHVYLVSIKKMIEEPTGCSMFLCVDIKKWMEMSSVQLHTG